jgi:hypothetical protein
VPCSTQNFGDRNQVHEKHEYYYPVKDAELPDHFSPPGLAQRASVSHDFGLPEFDLFDQPARAKQGSSEKNGKEMEEREGERGKPLRIAVALAKEEPPQTPGQVWQAAESRRACGAGCHPK